MLETAIPQIISFTWPAAIAVIASVIAIVVGVSRFFTQARSQLEIAKLWTQTKQHETSINAINGDLGQIREGIASMDKKLDDRTENFYRSMDGVTKALSTRIDERFDVLNQIVIEHLSNR